MTFLLLRGVQRSALADSCAFPAWDSGSVGNEVGDDDRGEEEEEAEDEVPDEAVAFSAGDAGGPERDCDPDDSKQDPPDDEHGRFLSAFRTERSYLLPDGSVGTSDVAASGRCAHHPGITPGGVICGGRANSREGRGVRRAGPRACTHG